MNLLFWTKSEPKKPKSKARDWMDSITFAVVAATLIRWTTVEAFVIPTPSMEDSALVGDFLFVSKFHYGTRLTTTPLQIPLTHQKIWGTDIPSYVDWIRLKPYRFPGISEVKRGDVVVFNVPPIQLNEGVLHPITLKNNYVKRCVGLPGDQLIIHDRDIIVNGEKLPMPTDGKFSYLMIATDKINEKNIRRLDLGSDDIYELGYLPDGRMQYRLFVPEHRIQKLREVSYIESITLDTSESEIVQSNIFPSAKYGPWNGDNYGPLVIPAKGMTIAINDSTLAFYGSTIVLYEGLDKVNIADGKLIIDGKSVDQYTFTQGYYFMMGDNRHNSLDSRYWGFVPDDHIVGKAMFVWLSVDKDADWAHKIRWSRLFSRIH